MHIYVCICGVCVCVCGYSDDDMQSTFSAVSAGQDSLQFDEEEEVESVDSPDLTTHQGIDPTVGYLFIVSVCGWVCSL